MTQPFYIRKSQAAALLSISERTINRYISSGTLAEYELPSGYKRLRSEDVLGLPQRSKRVEQ